MIRSATKPLLLSVMLLALAACAAGAPEPPAPGLDGSDDHGAGSGPRGGPGGPGGPGGGGADLRLFISPAGKPYRGKPGEPYASAIWFAEADKDHDGRISRAEFRADAEAFFHELDTDHNGVVDGFEIGAYERSIPEMLPRVRDLAPGEGMDLNLGQADNGRVRENVGGAGRAPRGGPAGGRQGAGLFGFIDQPEPVTVADTDFDGRVSLAETLAAADRRFDILDKNADGFITLAELPKTPVQAFAERQEEQRKKRAGEAATKPKP